MKNGKYYSSVRYRKKDYKGLVIGILSAVLIILIAFCIWAVATFAGGGEGAFENQTDRLSDLKIENEALKIENAELKEEIEKYKSGFYDEEEPDGLDDEQESKDNDTDSGSESDKESDSEADKENKKTSKPSKSPKKTATPKPTPTPEATVAPTREPEPETAYEGQSSSGEENAESGEL